MTANRPHRYVLAALLLMVVTGAAAQRMDTGERAPMDHSGMDHSQMNHSQMDHSQMGHSQTDQSGMDRSPTEPSVTARDGAEASDAMPAHGDMGHGDHNPKFGGLVLMYGVLHFEIVARADGAVELHLSDAMRTPMPAMTVSDVTVEVERPGGAFENIPMTVSEAGDFWQGLGDPLDTDQDTTVHLAFVAFGEPYVYALPLDAVQPEPPVPAETRADADLARAASHRNAA